MPALVVLTTVPSRTFGRKIARDLVAKRLAACVSMSAPLESIYRWKGKVRKARELLLIIKTSKKKFSKLEIALKKSHPYDVPEILALLVVAGSQDYLKWIEESVK